MNLNVILDKPLLHMQHTLVHVVRGFKARVSREALTRSGMAPDGLSGVLRQRFKPAPSGVIVVRSRVGDGVRDVVVGEMRITRIGIETELEHPDTRQFELITKRNNVGSDNAEVFGNEWQVTQLRPNGLEESSATAAAAAERVGGCR
jgi:alpha-D-ribose 1-methylphosphonate 5-triphosphate synthase subunit PhnG